MKNIELWKPGVAPVAVVMISLNEAHNIEGVLNNLKGWAQEVYLVDSCSTDETIDIALRFGINVVQRKFKGFGDQWNFALSSLPIYSPWTMKLDPDERLSEELKISIVKMLNKGNFSGLQIIRRLWFMGVVLPVEQKILRVWRTGLCRFTDVAVNEHPLVDGRIDCAHGYLEHHDSPDLDHWTIKQNRYTTAEAISQSQKKSLALPCKLFGTPLQRRMWLKKYFWIFPGRYSILFMYHYFFVGAWRAGRVGWIWSHLRTEVYRQWEYKYFEIISTGRLPTKIPTQAGNPDPRVTYFY